MSEAQQKKRRQIKLSRLEIVAELYKRGNTIRKIQAEVMRRLDLETYATSTVQRDINTLLVEWRKSRIEDMDLAIQLELERIDDNVRELYEQWEKSKEDYTKTSAKKLGAPRKTGNGNEEKLKTIQKEETETEVVQLGNPAYMAEIRQQLIERRKLLGLYAPERRELTGKDGKDLMNEPIVVRIIDSLDQIDDTEDKTQG